MNLSENEPKKLLEKLCKLLKGTEKFSVPIHHEDVVKNPAYDESLQEFYKTVDQLEVCTAYVTEDALKLQSAAQKRCLKVCSIGCGDGSLDKEILESITNQIPDMKFHYVGIDINQQTCDKARTCFQSMGNMEAKIIHANVEQMNESDVEPCDLIIGSHFLYYITSLEKVLSTAMSWLAPSGLALFFICRQGRSRDLKNCFWMNERGFLPTYTPDIARALQSLAIPFVLDELMQTMDLTECFRGNFEQRRHKLVLDFMAQTQLHLYPVQVTQTCIDYLRLVTEGQPEKFLLPIPVDVFRVEK